MIWRIAFFTVPTLVFLLISFSLNPLIRKTDSTLLKMGLNVAVALVGFFILSYLIRFFARKAKISEPRVGLPADIWRGFAIGILLSVASGFAFAFTQGKVINWIEFFAQFTSTLYTQIPSAVNEEVVFRFGIVHGVAALANPMIGLLAGSIPFGVLHLLDLFFGVPIDFAAVVGITLAGGLLSLIYLRWGLWAAVGCHYAWNAMCGPWVSGMGLEKHGGYAQLEGAWTTSFFILIACLIVGLPVFRTILGWHAIRSQAFSEG